MSLNLDCEGSDASQLRVLTSLLSEGLMLRWVPFLSCIDVERFFGACRVIRRDADLPFLWKEIAFTHRFVDATALHSYGPSSQLGLPWRSICRLHETVRSAWHHGAPATLRIDVREELRKHRLADLEVLIVEFLAGGEALVLGHSKGVVSIWQIDDSIGASSVNTGREPAAAGVHARILGVFRTSRKHDVQDLHISPTAASQPAALLLGQRHWLAMAVGPSAFIWQSCSSTDDDRHTPATTVGAWELIGALRHRRLFSSEHHAVWVVRLCDEDATKDTAETGRLAVTTGEDCILRVWRFGGDVGVQGTVLWQQEVGDARQAVPAMISVPAGHYNKSDRESFLVVALARADRRSLCLFDAETGSTVAAAEGVWQETAFRSLPQAAVYDTCGQSALFSSISEAGGGLLTRVDLQPMLSAMDASGDHHHELQPEAPAVGTEPLAPTQPQSVPRPELIPPLATPVPGPLTGPSRALYALLALPAAEAFLAIVSEGDPEELLEIWDRNAALGLGAPVSGRPLYRGRVAPFFGNPRFLAVGGRRLVLLDPTALVYKGELCILEWNFRPRKHSQASKAFPAAKASLSRIPRVQSCWDCTCYKALGYLLGCTCAPCWSAKASSPSSPHARSCYDGIYHQLVDGLFGCSDGVRRLCRDVCRDRLPSTESIVFSEVGSP
eukprot:gnl/TRDRNA2_/TRDRNA2_142603_c0_seq1.p1 gnl/TRDRNA2_/TRDRNA2_142603_c0~~gnl/TRDRNA2_/TRDRNA2_142603_c0_seq1.p1  ORF type:complete len:669 (+),score=71.77 gnl/TRDRNA2_/TRDRNA2_142603_c0_seq1:33-2039(+)